MNQENERYNKVINLLKVSKPKLESSEEIENGVINRISNARPLFSALTVVFDFLFSWVYIGWVRRSLMAVSVVLVVIFIYQQSVILKRIDFLSRQSIVIGKENITEPVNKFERILMNYKNGLRKLPSKNITISEKQMNELIQSVNELQLKYKDLEKLIEDDPEIKKLIEKKLIENSRTKI